MHRAFNAISRLDALEDVNFTVINDMLQRARDFLDEGANLLATMAPTRSDVEEPLLAQVPMQGLDPLTTCLRFRPLALL